MDVLDRAKKKIPGFYPLYINYDSGIFASCKLIKSSVLFVHHHAYM